VAKHNEWGQANLKQMNGRGQSKLEWGQELDEGQWVWQAKMAGKQKPAEQALQANTAC